MSYLKRIRPRRPRREDVTHSDLLRLAHPASRVGGMVSNGFSIAAPADPGMLDVVGYDTATPQLISDFARGAL
jgi:hypothetical protein